MHSSQMNHSINISLRVLIFTLLIGCTKEPNINNPIINLDNYVPITKEMFLENFNPSNNYNCYEIRYSFCFSSENYQAVYTFNPDYLKSCDSIIRLEFDSIKPVGVAFLSPNCLPWCCHYFIVTINNDNVNICYNEETLRDFLGTIDSKSDALFWAYTHGYFFRLNDIAHGGIFILNNKYYVYSYQVEQTKIDWIKTREYIIEVTPNGDINIIKDFNE